MAKSMKPGGGGRFAALKAKLAKRGATDPAALAAWIGRRKYGKTKMKQWSAKGRKKKNPLHAHEKRYGAQ